MGSVFPLGSNYPLGRRWNLSASRTEYVTPASNPALMAAPEAASDEDLIARIAAGDRDAFAALYRRRRSDVYRFALHLTGSPTAADDCTQDVFMDVIHHAARYQPGRSGVTPWLLGITRNHARRAAAARPTLPLPDVDAPAPRSLTLEQDPLAGLARRQHVAALRRALLALPVKYREAVVLCDLEELSYLDAAAALGCAIGTVRSRLHRGRALLARRLRADEGALFPNPATRWLL